MTTSDTDYMLADSDERDTADDGGRSVAKRSTHRGELATIGGGGDALVNLRARAAAAEVEMRRVRVEDCPGCTVGSYLQRHCRNSMVAAVDHGLDDKPLCKHAEPAKVARMERERVQARFDRLVRAGCRDEEILALVPPRVASLLPPLDWFGDAFGPANHATAEGLVAAIVERRHRYRAAFLVGVVGSGKSVLAASGLARCERAGLWIPATHVEDGERWRLLVSSAHSASAVVIDDLGRERNGWPVEALKSLITDLLDSSTPLIVTTNLDDDAFVARYLGDPSPEQPSGTRLRSRMQSRVDWQRLGRDNLRARSTAERRRRDAQNGGVLS